MAMRAKSGIREKTYYCQGVSGNKKADYIEIDLFPFVELQYKKSRGGEASEPWCDFVTGKAMTAAVDELEDELNDVLQRWLDKYQVEAGWYKETGKTCSYSFDGTDFIRL